MEARSKSSFNFCEFWSLNWGKILWRTSWVWMYSIESRKQVCANQGTFAKLKRQVWFASLNTSKLGGSVYFTLWRLQLYILCGVHWVEWPLLGPSSLLWLRAVLHGPFDYGNGNPICIRQTFWDDLVGWFDNKIFGFYFIVVWNLASSSLQNKTKIS